MLFFSKKPTELAIVDLNKKEAEIKKRLASFDRAAGEKGLACVLSKLRQKAEQKAQKDDKTPQKTLYVLDFQGDIKASAVDRLREEVSVVVACAKAGDEVVLRLESAGGQVHGYGLAAAQLDRLKRAGVLLTVCVDKVAASGGYMMACVADKVIAAPFSVIGSIGVVSQMPNFHEWLKKHDIDVHVFTAGEYKRTVTVFGKNSEEDCQKYQSELDRIHELFKDHVRRYRANLDIDKVASGEFWLGTDAQALGLVDEIGTSDAYILQKLGDHKALALHSRQKPTALEKLGINQAGADALSGLTRFASDRLGVLAKASDRLPL